MTHLNDTQINEYLDRQLDPAGQAHLTAHLASCSECRRRLSDAEQLFLTIESLPDVPLMVDLSQQVMARLSAEVAARSQDRWTLPRWSLPLIVLQFAAALVLFGWLWPVVGSVLETTAQSLPETAERLLPELSPSRLFSPLAASLARFAELGQSLSPDTSLPIFEGFLIIGLGMIIWLAGSGLLLRQSLLVQNDFPGER